MSEFELLHRLGAALAIGLLIGLERGWRQRDEEAGQRTAGLRTYALSGLLGGVAGILSPLTSGLAVPVTLAAYTLAMGAFHWLEARAEGNFSVTGVVAGMVTVALGAYAALGDLTVAAAGAAATAGLLALRQPLHDWLKTLSWPEIRAAMILTAMTFLLLPVLPDRTFDPWEAVNPAEVWLMAIVIAGVSFAGYVAVKIMGNKAGIAAAALAGGLASSTAATLTFARMARDDKGSGAGLLAGGVLIAGTVMVARVLVVAGALNPRLVPTLAVPLGTAAVVMALIGGVLLLRRHNGEGGEPNLEMKTPFEFGTVLKFAALLAVITLIAKVALAKLGQGGLYAVAFLSGIADVDALTLSVARMPDGSIAHHVAATAIGIAVAVNTVSKAVMCAIFGNRALAVVVGAASAAAIAAGAVAMTFAPE